MIALPEIGSDADSGAGAGPGFLDVSSETCAAVSNQAAAPFLKKRRVSTTGPDAERPNIMGSASRQHGGARSRFVGTSHHGRYESAALVSNHPALVEGRTLFPTRVRRPGEVDRVLVDGHNNAKIGRFIEKGAWSGMPVLTLTLEERKTCPRSCDNWASCYGNAMPMPRRHAHGPDLVAALDEELRFYALQAPHGFAVRLHVLGDFYSLEYVAAWRYWIQNIPHLHVWGYTARLPGTEIGGVIQSMNEAHAERWRIRFSVPAGAPHGPMQVATIWRTPQTVRQPEGAVCPQQFEKTATCGTCGLCWAKGNDAERILFVGHGMNRKGRKA